MPRWPEENYISLASLIRSGVLSAGGYLSVTAYGETHTAVLLHSGAIQFKGRDFASPSSFSLFVKQIYNPTKKADDGWKSVCYKGKPLEEFRKMFRVSHGHFVEGAACTSKKRSKKKSGKVGKRAKKTMQDSPSRKYTPSGAIPRVVGPDPELQIRHNNHSPFFSDIQQEKASANFCKRVVLFGASNNSSRTDSEKNSTTTAAAAGTAADNNNTTNAGASKASLSMLSSNIGITSSNGELVGDIPFDAGRGKRKKSVLGRKGGGLPFRGDFDGGGGGGTSKQSEVRRRTSNCSTKIKLFRRKGNVSAEKGVEGRNDGCCQTDMKKKDWKAAAVTEQESKRSKESQRQQQHPLLRSKKGSMGEGPDGGEPHAWGKQGNDGSEAIEKTLSRGGVLDRASDGREKEIGSVSATMDCSKNGGSVSSMDSFNKAPKPSDLASKNRFSSSASRDNPSKRGFFPCHQSEGLGSRSRYSRSNPPVGSELGVLHHRVNCISIGDEGGPSMTNHSREMTNHSKQMTNHSIDSDVYWMANSGLRGEPIDSISTEETTDGTGFRKARGVEGEDSATYNRGARLNASEGEEVDPCFSMMEMGGGERAEKGGLEESCAEKKRKKSCGKRKDPTFNWWRCTNCGKFRKVISNGLSHQNTFICDFNGDERYNRCPVPQEKRVDFSGRLSVQAFLEFSHRPPLVGCTANEFYHDLSVFLHKVENQKKHAREIQNRQFEMDLFSLYKAVVRGGGLHVFCQRMDLKSFRLLKIMLATNEVFIPGGCVAAAKEFIKFLAAYERACFKRDFEFYEQTISQPIVLQPKKFATKITV